MQNKSEQSTYELVSEWLDKYHSETNKYKKARAKALIVTQMLPIIKKIARTIARRSYDPIEDLVQAGAIGLLKAIDAYSENINDNFKIFAGYYIIGEMKHFLRDKTSTIRVPRHMQELAFRINSFIKALTVEELNELTNDDVAEALKVSRKNIDLAFQVDRRCSTLSLDDLYTNDSNNLGYEEVITKENYKDARELEDTKIVLREIIEKLPPESKKLVKAYYYDDLSQKEIARKFNLTPMQVSRKLKKAFSILYKLFVNETEEENDD